MSAKHYLPNGFKVIASNRGPGEFVVKVNHIWPWMGSYGRNFNLRFYDRETVVVPVVVMENGLERGSNGHLTSTFY